VRALLAGLPLVLAACPSPAAPLPRAQDVPVAASSASASGPALAGDAGPPPCEHFALGVQRAWCEEVRAANEKTLGTAVGDYGETARASADHISASVFHPPATIPAPSANDMLLIGHALVSHVCSLHPSKLPP